MTRPSASMRRTVVRRASERCEYCRIHQADSASQHQVDHIISEKHGGITAIDNLALSCLTCNRRKASDIGAIDPTTGELTPLFHPRLQLWREHFRVENALILGRTSTGRATAEFLRLNASERILERAALIRAGRLPLP